MAKRFCFRFETLLRIRRQREDEHKRIVAARVGQIRQVKERMNSLDQQIHDELQAIRESQSPGRIDMHQVVRHRHWLGCLHKAVLEGQAQLRGLEAQLAQERVALAEAAKQRRILDKLKERQSRRFQEELDRQETRAADDMAGLRFVYDAQAMTS